jgi:hypothetical protein
MDLFSTNVLTEVVNSLPNDPPFFLLDTFFPNVQTEESEEIHFDIEPSSMGLAPFVLPVVEGQLMSNQGYETATFKPAYIKPKRAFDNSTTYRRAMGEGLTGTLSRAQRFELNVSRHLEIDRKMIRRRLEWMAASILRTGAVTISGEKYPTKVVNFGRAVGLTVTLSGAAKWDQSGVNPLTDMGTWASVMGDNGGSFPSNWVMDTAAWNVFRNHADIKENLELVNGAGSLSLDISPNSQFGAYRAGMIDNHTIWVYAGSYKDESGTVTKFLPTGTVLAVGDLDGVQAYGAILDLKAGLQAVPMFSKSWEVEDPSVRFIMTQSAPLLVPRRVNNTFAATVI